MVLADRLWRARADAMFAGIAAAAIEIGAGNSRAGAEVGRADTTQTDPRMTTAAVVATACAHAVAGGFGPTTSRDNGGCSSGSPAEKELQYFPARLS